MILELQIEKITLSQKALILSSQKSVLNFNGIIFVKEKTLKKTKQIVKILLLLLVFLTGASSNVLFAKSSVLVEKTSKIIPLENSPNSVPFFFQPIEDFQNEDDDHLSIESDLYSFSVGVIELLGFNKSPSVFHNQLVIERRIWCINSNFRL